jgi:hypothetical protein
MSLLRVAMSRQLIRHELRPARQHAEPQSARRHIEQPGSSGDAGANGVIDDLVREHFQQPIVTLRQPFLGAQPATALWMHRHVEW